MAKKSNLSRYPYKDDGSNVPAPVLEVSLSLPIDSEVIVRTPALVDSGASITVIPQNIVEQLQLRYVDEIRVIGVDMNARYFPVYSVKIIFDRLGEFVIRAIAYKNSYALIGRDLLNKWSVFLKGREKILEISK